MDDDAEPEEDALGYLTRYTNGGGISALASAVKLPGGGLSLHHRWLHLADNCLRPMRAALIPTESYSQKKIKIDGASFVGLLVNRDAVTKIGLPKGEFFIHFDDGEYCARLRHVGDISLIPESIILHKEARNDPDARLRTYVIPYDKLWISYFWHRNMVWLYKTHTKGSLKALFYASAFYGRSIIKALLLGDHKIRRLLFFTGSFIDGMRGVFDNGRPKRILGIDPQ